MSLGAYGQGAWVDVTDPVWGAAKKWNTVITQYGSTGDADLKKALDAVGTYNVASNAQPYIILIGNDITMSAAYTLTNKNIVLRKTESNTVDITGNEGEKYWNYDDPWINPSPASPDLYDNEPDWKLNVNSNFRHFYLSSGTIYLTLENITLDGGVDPSSTSNTRGGLSLTTPNNHTITFAGVVTRCRASTNTAANFGGAVFNLQHDEVLNTTLNIRGGVFADNSSDNTGGVIATLWQHSTYLNPTVNIGGYSIFERNTAKTYGGVYASYQGVVTVTDNVIMRGNKARTGGAILMKGGNLTISGNAVISDNIADYSFGSGGAGDFRIGSGGAVTMVYQNSTLNMNFTLMDNAQITRNKATRSGGGIAIFDLNSDGTNNDGTHMVLNLLGGSITNNIATGETRELASGATAIEKSTIGAGGGIYANFTRKIMIPANSTTYFNGNLAAYSSFIDNTYIQGPDGSKDAFYAGDDYFSHILNPDIHTSVTNTHGPVGYDFYNLYNNFDIGTPSTISTGLFALVDVVISPSNGAGGTVQEDAGNTYYDPLSENKKYAILGASLKYTPTPETGWYLTGFVMTNDPTLSSSEFSTALTGPASGVYTLKVPNVSTTLTASFRRKASLTKPSNINFGTYIAGTIPSTLEKTITLHNNIPNDAWSDTAKSVTVTLTGGDATLFVLTTGDNSIIPGQTNTSWKVKPGSSGFSTARTYTTTVKITYNDGKETQTMNIPVSLIVLASGKLTLPDAEAGGAYEFGTVVTDGATYYPVPNVADIEILNVGTGTCTDTEVELLNELKDGMTTGNYFTLTSGAIGTVSSGAQNTDAKLTPASNLAAGDYKADLRLIWKNAGVSDTVVVAEAVHLKVVNSALVTFRDDAPGNPAAVVDFGTQMVGYSSSALSYKNITFVNSGDVSAEITQLTVAGADSAFQITGPAFSDGGNVIAVVPGNGSGTSWSIKPKNALAPGAYSVSLTITYKNGMAPGTTLTANGVVTFTVTRPPFGGSVSVPALPVEVGTLATFTGSSLAAPAGMSFDWAFDFGGDCYMADTTGVANGVGVSTAWWKDGVKTVTATIRCLQGNSVLTDSVIVIPITVLAPAFSGIALGVTPSSGASGTAFTGTVSNAGTPVNMAVKYFWLGDQYFQGGYSAESDYNSSGMTYGDLLSKGVENGSSSSFSWVEPGVKDVWALVRWVGRDSVTVYDTLLHQQVTVTAISTTVTDGKTAYIRGTEHLGSIGSPYPVYYKIDTIKYGVRILNSSLLTKEVTVIDTLPLGLQTPFEITHGGVWNATDRTITWKLDSVQGANGGLGGGRDTVWYKATPALGEAASGTVFDNSAKIYYDRGGTVVTTNKTYHKATPVTATFSFISIPAGVAAGGSLSGTTTPQTLDYGQTPTAGITAVPNAGYTFTGWMIPKYQTVSGVTVDTVGGVADYTTVPVRAATQQFVAVFRLDTPAFGMSVGATPSASVLIYDTVKFTASFTTPAGLSVKSYSWRFTEDAPGECSVSGLLSSSASPAVVWTKGGTKRVVLELTFQATSDLSRVYSTYDTIYVEVGVPDFGTVITPSPLTGVVGTDFGFSVSPAYYPAYRDTFAWTFDGVDNIVTGYLTRSPSVRWYDTGVKQASVTLTYYKGSTAVYSATLDTTIAVIKPLFTGTAVSINGTTVSGVYSGAVSTGTAVAFAAVSVPAAPPHFTASYLWSFPNGATPASSTSASETVTWYDHGSKTVSLQVKYTADNGGGRYYDTLIYVTVNVQPVVTTSTGGLSASLYGVHNDGSVASPVAVYYTDTIVYAVALENLSLINTNVSFSDTLPAGLKFAGWAAGTPGSPVTPLSGSRIVSWSGTVGLNGGKDTIRFMATPAVGQSGQALTNTGAVITYDNGGRVVTTNVTYHRGSNFTIQFKAASSGGTLSSGDISRAFEYKDPLSGVLTTPMPSAGYSFAGWSHPAYQNRMGATVPAASGLASYSSLIADGSYTLTAEFEPVTYTVSYTLNGGDTVGCSNPLSYTVLTTPVALKAPKRNGYKFLGWISPAGSTTATPVPAPQLPPVDGLLGNRSFEAKWEIIRYKITYVQPLADKQATGNPLSYTVDTANITLSTPVRYGYTFTGWSFVSSDGVAIPTGNVIPHGTYGNITATATWSAPITYNITYSSTGVVTPPSTPNRATYNITDAFSLHAPDAVTPGWQFTGYDIVSDSAGAKDDGGPGPLLNTTDVPAGMFGNLTVTPVLTARQYKVTYSYSSDVTSKPSLAGYDVLSLPDTVHSPSRRGYTFGGWIVTNLTTPGLNTNIVNDSIISAGTIGNLLFKDSWTAKIYTVTYDTVAGVEFTNGAPATYQINESSDLHIPDASRNGYDFIGWEIKYTSGGGLVASSSSVIPSKVHGDLTLKPVFSIHTYNINYVLGGGSLDPSSGPNPVTYTIEEAPFTIPSSPSRLGYTFTGWTLASDESSAPVSSFTSPTVPAGMFGNLTLTAQWLINPYTVTYTDSLSGPIVGDGALTYSYTVTSSFTFGSSPVADARPQNAGRVFVGWTGSNGASLRTSVTVPVGSVGNRSYVSHYSYRFEDNLPDDTLYYEAPSATSPVVLPSGGDGVSYQWSLPDGSSSTAPSVTASLSGPYILTTNYGPVTVSDTVTVLFAFDDMTALLDISTEPAKVGMPQRYMMNVNPLVAPYTSISWSLPSSVTSSVPAGAPYAASLSGTDTVSVVYPATGNYTVSCVVTVIMGGTTYTRTFSLPVNIAAKSRGWFVAYEEYSWTRAAGVEIASQARNDGATRAARTVSGAGTSWEGAFMTLDEALAVATKGDFIWVAKGVYSPANGSYNLTNDEVQIYGGFAGNETNLNQRNFALNETVLLGSASGGSVIINQGVSSAARWDGFIIEGGKAVSGGGILNINASPTIANCVIRNNIATSYGGGIASLGIGSAPFIYNTEISGNTAAYGGGLYFSFSSLSSLDVVSSVLTNVTVAGNYASEAGGGVYTENAATSTVAEFRNSIIYGNRSASTAVADVSGSSKALFASSIVYGSGGSRAWNPAFGIDGGGNYDGNPLFVRGGFDSDGRMIPGDYYFKASEGYAPYNAGNDAFLNIGRHAVSMPLLLPDPLNDAYYSDRLLYDLSGWERKINGNCDIGAYEYNPDYPYGVHGPNGIDDDFELKRQVIIRTADGMRSLPGAGIHYISSHTDMIIKVVALEGWSIANLSVVTGSIQMDTKKGVTIKFTGDTAYVTLHQVVEELDVRFNGISRDGADGAPTVVAPSRTKMYFYAGRLYVKPSAPVRVYVFTLTGVLFGVIDFVEEGSVWLPQGTYVARSSDGVVLKIIKN